MDVSDDPGFCARQVRRHDYDRYLCALFAPAERREALTALYAFNLEIASIRELVGEPLLGHMRLHWWRDTLDAVYAGGAPRHPVARPLGDAVRRFGLARAHFDRLLKAREFDLGEDAPADMDALLDYVEATSATLVALAFEILGVADDAARDAGRNVGIAWGLTGLLRSVPFHAAARRVYLPTTVSREAGLDLAGLFALRPGDGLARAVADLAGVARRYLEAARRHRGKVPKRALPALLPATLAGDYLSGLEKAGYDPFARPTRVAGPRPIVKLAAAAFLGRF